MAILVLLVGALISITSLYLMVRVETMAGLLQRVMGGPWRYAAALLRLLLGAVLIGSADLVAYGAIVQVFGWLFVLGGLGLVVIPDGPLLSMVGWFGRLSPLASRLWLGLALLFGLFFVYAALA